MGMGVGECPMHAQMHTHACTCMLNMLNMLNMDASMSVAICNFYTCIHVCVCVCVHGCACIWGHPTYPQMPPDTPNPPAPSPEPQGTNQDNSILFEDSLALNIPELI